MITELARIHITPGTDEDFVAAVERSVPLFRNSRGNLGVSLAKVLEEADVYLLTVGWETLEDHTVGFRGSEAFAQWRENVSLYFAKAPSVVHLQPLIASESVHSGKA